MGVLDKRARIGPEELGTGIPVRERHLRTGVESAAGKSVLEMMKNISPCGRRQIKRKEEILKGGDEGKSKILSVIEGSKIVNGREGTKKKRRNNNEEVICDGDGSRDAGNGSREGGGKYGHGIHQPAGNADCFRRT